MTLWSGRFSASMAQSLWELSESYSFDHVLYAYDLRGSRAHVAGLVAAGLLEEADGGRLVAALDEVEAEFDRGAFVRAADDEDIHMAIERRVTELCGDVGARLHTGRSRNDQVATDLAPVRARRGRARSRAPSSTWWRRCASAPTGTPTRSCRATRTSSAPSPSC